MRGNKSDHSHSTNFATFIGCGAVATAESSLPSTSAQPPTNDNNQPSAEDSQVHRNDGPACSSGLFPNVDAFLSSISSVPFPLPLRRSSSLDLLNIQNGNAAAVTQNIIDNNSAASNVPANGDVLSDSESDSDMDIDLFWVSARRGRLSERDHMLMVNNFVANDSERQGLSDINRSMQYLAITNEKSSKYPAPKEFHKRKHHEELQHCMEFRSFLRGKRRVRRNLYSSGVMGNAGLCSKGHGHHQIQEQLCLLTNHRRYADTAPPNGVVTRLPPEGTLTDTPLFITLLQCGCWCLLLATVTVWMLLVTVGHCCSVDDGANCWPLLQCGCWC